MERGSVPACPLCKKPYSTASPPMYLTCKASHAICKGCLQGELDKQIPSFDCPIDNEKVDLQGKTIANFKPNRDLFRVIEAQEKEEKDLCQIHRVIEDIFCITCKKKICHYCERANHREKDGHLTEPYFRLIEMADDNFSEIQANINKIDETLSLPDRALESGENFQQTQLEAKFQEVYKMLLLKKQILEEQIFEHFQELRRSELSLGDERIVKWRNETQQLIDSIKKPNLSPSDREKIIVEIFQRGEDFKKLSVDKWERDGRQLMNSLKQEFEDLSINYNNMLLRVIEELPLGEFNPHNPQFGKQDQSKVECSPYIIKLKENNPLKKVKALFNSLQSEEIIDIADSAGRFEVTDYFLNDSLAIRIESLVKNARDKEKVALSAGIKEAILRCNDLTNKGIESMSNFLVHFQSLKKISIDFEQCSQVAIENLNDFLLCLPCCEDLVELNLSLKKMKITNEELFELMGAIGNFKNLRILALDFSRCENLTNEGLKNGLKYLSYLQKLEKLHLLFKGCTNVNDQHLKKIGRCFTSLENLNCLKLDFTRCPNFTNAGNHIQLGLRDKLESLEIDIIQDT